MRNRNRLLTLQIKPRDNLRPLPRDHKPREDLIALNFFALDLHLKLLFGYEHLLVLLVAYRSVPVGRTVEFLLLRLGLRRRVFSEVVARSKFATQEGILLSLK